MKNIEKYENRVIAFIDILGFSSILEKTQTRKENGENVENTENIRELCSAFERIADLMGVNEEPEDAAPSRRVTQFSDSIVISFKQGESLAAVSPRIILPKSLADREKEHADILKQQTHKLEDILSLDEDDFYYLDYFDKCQNPELALFVNDAEYVDHLLNMKQVILNGLQTQNPGIYSKYGWMKTKWNSTVWKYQREDWQIRLTAENRQQLGEYFLNEKLIEDSM